MPLENLPTPLSPSKCYNQRLLTGATRTTTWGFTCGQKTRICGKPVFFCTHNAMDIPATPQFCTLGDRKYSDFKEFLVNRPGLGRRVAAVLAESNRCRSEAVAYRNQRTDPRPDRPRRPSTRRRPTRRSPPT